MPNRISLSKRLRFEVFKRDGFTCVYCGRTPPSVVLHCDHVIPVKDGGRNEEVNLVTSCSDCNFGKGAVSLNSIPETLAFKTARIAEMEDQVRGFEALVSERRERISERSWEIAEILLDGWGVDPVKVGINKKWLASIKMFVELMPFDELVDAAEITNRKAIRSKSGSFSYFCGVCWRKIKGGEDGSN